MTTWEWNKEHPDGPRPEDYKAVLPSVPVRLHDLETGQGSFSVVATFADGRELMFTGNSHLPQAYGVFCVNVNVGPGIYNHGPGLKCADKRVVASLAEALANLTEDEYDPEQHGYSLAEVPVLDEDATARAYERLSIPCLERDRLKKCEAKPVWPLGLWLGPSRDEGEAAPPSS